MRSTLLLVFGLSLLAACDGDTGPTGPQGPAGPQGPQGPAGSANVSTGTFTVAPTAWTNGFWFLPVDGGTQGNPARVATVAVAGITAELVNNGAVLVYLRVPSTPTGASNQWTLLPFHQGGFGGGYLVSIKAAVSAGQVRIGYAHESTSGTAAPDVYNVPLPTYEFKWVGIPGATTSSLSASLRANPDNLIAALTAERRALDHHGFRSVLSAQR